MERIKLEVQGSNINAFYLDSGTLCGSRDDLIAALATVEEDGPIHSLALNRVDYTSCISQRTLLSKSVLFPLKCHLSDQVLTSLALPLALVTIARSMHRRVWKV